MPKHCERERFFLLRVVVVLSSIAAVADCCTSRIVLMQKDMVQHEKDLIDHRNQLDYEDYGAMTAPSSPPNTVGPVESTTASQNDTTFSTLVPDDVAETSSIASTQEPPPQPALPALAGRPNGRRNFTRRPSPEGGGDVVSDGGGGGGDSGSTVREQHADNRKYNVIDIYYTIMRDVLSFNCSGQYLTDFCLNGGRCFRYPVGNHSFFSCECADGYVGERCESKSLNGVYLPSTAALTAKQPEIRTARIVFSYPMLVAISTVYLIFGAIMVFKCPGNQRTAGMAVSG